MSNKRLRCYVGNYDGQRDGLIVAANQVEATHLLHCSLHHFRMYWSHTTLSYFHKVALEPKLRTLYTRKNDYHSEWQEGICPL